MRTSLAKQKRTDYSKGRIEQADGAAQAWGAEVTLSFLHMSWDLELENLLLCDVFTALHAHLQICTRFCTFWPLLRSCAALSARPQAAITAFQSLVCPSSLYLCTAATPSSVWNHAGCSHIPRGSVPVLGAGDWRAAQTPPFPTHEACFPREIAVYETVRIKVI